MLNRLLDMSVIFSFDKSGFLRHKKYFVSEDFCDLSDRKILVTGGTSGIGLKVTQTLVACGASLFYTGRNRIKGKKNERENQKFIPLDMADWKAIDSFVACSRVLDAIVLNAGGMPEYYTENSHGVELQAASQLFGHYYLIKSLRDKGKLGPDARIVWVSSGGMYLKKLDLDNLLRTMSYDKVDVYANVKRAQVTLVEELAKDSTWSDIRIVSMHPGWVGTEGVKYALPKFYKLMKKRLRSLEQGADTIVWLLRTKKEIQSGGFYFDRKIVSPYISKQYIPTREQRAKLIDLLNSQKY